MAVIEAACVAIDVLELADNIDDNDNERHSDSRLSLYIAEKNGNAFSKTLKL